ncbi:Plasmodium vivax Vir protein, putative [Plasmodium vivax]|nr:Plasmodium vivax Vir protein, putative [Plasmodium vivax]
MTHLDLRDILGKIFVLPSKELPSPNFYDNLKNSYDNIYQHYEVCRALDSPHNKDMKIVRTCAKLIKYLKNYYKQQSEDKLKEHHYPNAPQAIECLNDVHLLTFNNWKESKDHYDYCVDYDKIMQLAGSSYEKCKIYEEYIKGKSELYKKFEKLYIPEYKKKNPGFYEKCKGYNPEIVIGELKCDEKFPGGARPKGVSHGQGLLASTPVPGQNSDSTNTYGNVLLGVVVTSMTSGILYKFTPLGRRFRNGFGWNNYAASNVNGEGNMLFAETHDPFSPHSEEREHHIGYLPA